MRVRSIRGHRTERPLPHPGRHPEQRGHLLLRVLEQGAVPHRVWAPRDALPVPGARPLTEISYSPTPRGTCTPTRHMEAPAGSARAAPGTRRPPDRACSGVRRTLRRHGIDLLPGAVHPVGQACLLSGRQRPARSLETRRRQPPAHRGCPALVRRRAAAIRLSLLPSAGCPASRSAAAHQTAPTRTSAHRNVLNANGGQNGGQDEDPARSRHL